MEEITLIVAVGGAEKQERVPSGQSLLKSLRDMGVHVRALCGERGVCGSCKVRLIRGEIAASDADKAFFSEEDLAAGWRLACTAFPDRDVCIDLPDSGEDAFSGVSAFQYADREQGDRHIITIEQIELVKSKASLASQIAGGGGLGPTRQQDTGRVEGDGRLGLTQLQEAGRAAAGYGPVLLTRYGGRIVSVSQKPAALYAIGIDIGTTTLGFALVDLQTGTVAGTLSMVNRQREYGADVITRIVKAKHGDLLLLSRVIRGQLAEGAAMLCRERGVDPASVVKVAVAGNTTMLHLLLELSCDMLGSFPFTPVTLAPLTLAWAELFDGAFSCEVDILPGISTYVGADITAGLYCLMLHKDERPGILLDIGTNGEMALAEKGRILCTSTAAGPALEGVNITWGTGSVPGAISTVHYEPPGFRVSTIGDRPPTGICGSGVIDSVYQFLHHGIIDASGRFQKDWANTGAAIAKTTQGEDIFISQKDIREVQLAKSAIRAGLEILIRQSGYRYDDIGALYIAGGFGYNIDFRSGVGIGLVPGELGDRIKVAGNSALGGLVRYLVSAGHKEAIDEIIGLASEFSLSEEESFQDMFIEYMSF